MFLVHRSRPRLAAVTARDRGAAGAAARAWPLLVRLIAALACGTQGSIPLKLIFLSIFFLLN